MKMRRNVLRSISNKKLSVGEVYGFLFALLYLTVFFYGASHVEEGNIEVVPMTKVRSENLQPQVRAKESTTQKHEKHDEEDTRYHYTSLTYSPEYNTSIRGKLFIVDVHTLSNLGLIRKTYANLTEDNVGDFVFATAANRHFFKHLQSTVSTIQRYKPNYKIYVYDLGLTDVQLIKMSSWCDVIYRRFDFGSFPPHVRQLHTYAWKPLAIAETLKEQPGVYWLDASGRITTGNFTVMLREVLRTGALSLTSTGHSVFAVTHPGMFRYLPGDMTAFKREEQLEGTFLFFSTKNVITRILRWVVLCALHRPCIAPISNRFCNFDQEDRFTIYAKCHRFDQSAFSITMLNHFNRSSWSYYSTQRTVKIERFPSKDREISECFYDPEI